MSNQKSLQYEIGGWLKLMVILLGASTVVAGCSGRGPAGGATPELETVRLPMGFIPNIQYAPFYVADARGYFRDAGIQVDFDYSTEIDGVALVGAGDVAFALASGEQVLLARSRGAPVVYVMAWFQDFPVAIAVRSDSGIESPEELAGRRVGIPGLFGASLIGYRAWINSLGLPEDHAELESIGFNQVEALTVGQIPAAVVYANNEPVQLEARGIEVNVYRVSDRVQLASNGLITNQVTIAERPELVRRMIGAMLRGLEATIADPQAAYEVSLEYVEGLAQADREIQFEILMRSIDFWRADRLGFSRTEAWHNMQEVLLDMELLAEPVDLTEAFTNEFLPE